MTSPIKTVLSPWASFLAHLFVILVAWTIFIKYLFPIGFALFSNEAWATYIYWDLWPVAHLWLAWALLARPWYARMLAIGMSVVEILIITTLFIWFLAEPEWSIWRTNWFVNKVFVLAAFVLVLGTALFRPETLKMRSS
ncbi:hypothetical protein DIT71_03195 [Marinobacter vulgaris]|uniref:Uncharacterized protein n=1 Tax=Marinobacter vulgaris TaxID=1928331 RepID=A0A2V3ZR70_9GAMM|nr:hypothetical protein [Marinobacter vulgaris]PXX93817.1 hypothetical protein DIT71_03195 [Marinobacter vulgaris]TSJ72163.1 hypothetical protein FPC41_00075 [Marinobacter vulgaris]